MTNLKNELRVTGCVLWWEGGWLVLTVAASAGVAAEPSTAATSPAVSSATFASGFIAAVAAAVVAAVAASVGRRLHLLYLLISR
jgi:hypothetical protein